MSNERRYSATIRAELRPPGRFLRRVLSLSDPCALGFGFDQQIGRELAQDVPGSFVLALFRERDAIGRVPFQHVRPRKQKDRKRVVVHAHTHTRPRKRAPAAVELSHCVAVPVQGGEVEPSRYAQEPRCGLADQLPAMAGADHRFICFFKIPRVFDQRPSICFR
jgi:hypothetical protein